MAGAFRHPGRNCGRKEVHQVHNWSDDDGTYFCYGDVLPVDLPFPEIVRRKLEEEDGQGWDPSMGDGTPEGTPQPGDVGYPGPDDPMRAQLEDVSYMKEKKRNLPVPWADRAMFNAEPIDVEEGPKVYLLWMTPDPLGAIAAACKMYKGEVVRDLNDISAQERLEYLAQVRKTKLQAPFEFVKFHFLIEGVTRAFTHQMVRQRTAVYAQESLRFAVVGDESTGLPVSLPPSLSGTEGRAPGDRFREGDNAAQKQRGIWDQAVHDTGVAYRDLVDSGIPAEDARGLLPHNITTRLHYSTDLRALLDHAGNRLCTQAQFEWRLVFARIVEAIRWASDTNHGATNGSSSVYMAGGLADLFNPVCYQTGKCEFKANFDRSCSIRERVDANSAINRPSSEWEKFHHDKTTGLEIGSIKPGEWLLDHTAARKK